MQFLCFFFNKLTPDDSKTMKIALAASATMNWSQAVLFDLTGIAKSQRVSQPYMIGKLCKPIWQAVE